MDRLEALLSCAQPSACLAAPPCSELSPQQHHQQQQARPPGATTSAAAHHRATAPYHHTLSPPIITGQAPPGLAGPSRTGATAAPDYVLRGSPPGRTALPPLASLANGPGPFDGGPPAPGPMPPSSRSSSSSLHHRERDRDREHASEQQQQQHRHGEVMHHQPYAPPPPPQLQQPLQPPHQQTKNSRAQTLTTPLGERLRLFFTTPQGPAAAVLRLCHHPSFFCRPRNSSRRRRRLLARAAQVRCCTAIEISMPVYRRHRRLFLVRQRNSGVQSVRSGSGSAAIPTHSNTSPTGTSSSRMGRGRRALCR